VPLEDDEANVAKVVGTDDEAGAVERITGETSTPVTGAETPVPDGATGSPVNKGTGGAVDKMTEGAVDRMTEGAVDNGTDGAVNKGTDEDVVTPVLNGTLTGSWTPVPTGTGLTYTVLKRTTVESGESSRRCFSPWNVKLE
jgi:hypothetical protein